MFTVTETVVTLPEVYLTVWDIDCFDDLGGACETISSDDHYTYLKGDNVWVEESAEGIKVFASMHCERPEQSREDVVDRESEMALAHPRIRRQGDFFS